MHEKLRTPDPPPSDDGTIIALWVIAYLAIPAGTLLLFVGFSENTPVDVQTGAAGFIGGWLLAGFAYALRRLQLIEWTLRRERSPTAASDTEPARV